MNLSAISRFAFANFQKTKQGFFIPNPPKRPTSELFIFKQLLKKTNQLKQYKELHSDPSFAVQERQEAREIFQEANAKYIEQVAEYKNQFNYPKAVPSPLLVYLSEQKEAFKNLTISQRGKIGSENFKKISQSELDAILEKRQQLIAAYAEAKKAYEQRNSQWKYPENLFSKTAYQYFVKDNFTNSGTTQQTELKRIAALWSSISDEQKNAYKVRAEESNKQIQADLLEFKSKLNLSDEDFKVLLAKKAPTKSSEATKEPTKKKSE